MKRPNRKGWVPIDYLEPSPSNSFPLVMRRLSWPFFTAGVLLLAGHLLPRPSHYGTVAGLPSICAFKTLTTIPCPGCGITRSFILSAHGDWAQALFFHPFGIILYIGLWAILFAKVLSLRLELPQIPQKTLLISGSVIAAALVLFWLLRITGVFPYPPQI